MKKSLILILVVMLLLISSCITIQAPVEEVVIEEPVVEEPIIEEPVVEEVEEVPAEVVEEEPIEEEEEDSLPEGQYLFNYEEPIIIDDMEIIITYMDSSASLTFTLEGVEYKLKETKAKQIYNDYSFSMLSYDFKGSSYDTTVLMEIVPFVLEENQYLLEKAVWVNVGINDIKLESSLSTDFIKVSLCDAGSRLYCTSQESIAEGASKEIKGQLVKNVNGFYKISQYAIVEVSDIE